MDRRAVAADRAVEGLFSRGEKSLLIYLAGQMPRWVKPDTLTILGVAGSLMTFGGLIASHASLAFLWVAVAGLLVNWFGDSLDGTLARVRRIERPRYGFFVDHVSDLASQFLIVLGLGLSPLMRFDVALLALIGYLALSVFTFVKLHISRTMQISYFGVGPTEVRLLIGSGLVLATTVALPTFTNVAMVGAYGLFDVVGFVLFVFAVVTIAIKFADDVGKLAVIDPPRQESPSVMDAREISDDVAGLEDRGSGDAATV